MEQEGLQQGVQNKKRNFYSIVHVLTSSIPSIKIAASKVLFSCSMPSSEDIVRKYNATDKHHALRKAAHSGNIEDVSVLIAFGANVNGYGNKSKKTPLAFASEMQRYDMIIFLLEKGADPLIKDASEIQPLFIIMNPDKNTPCKVMSALNRYLVQRMGASVSMEVLPDYSYLCAVQRKYPDNLYATDKFLASFFREGSKASISDLRSLINKYPALKTGYLQGCPILILVAMSRVDFKEKFALCAAFGANPNQTAIPEISFASFGNTPLHTLIANEDIEGTMEFTKAFKGKIDPAVTDIEGKTTLLLAVKMKRYDMVEHLLDEGFGQSAINIPDEDGNTTLHYAYLLGSQELVDALIQHGASHQKNNDGFLPYDMLNSPVNNIRKALISVEINPDRSSVAKCNQNMPSGAQVSLFKSCVKGRIALYAANNLQRQEEIGTNIASLFQSMNGQERSARVSDMSAEAAI